MDNPKATIKPFEPVSGRKIKRYGRQEVEEAIGGVLTSHHWPQLRRVTFDGILTLNELGDLFDKAPLLENLFISERTVRRCGEDFTYTPFLTCKHTTTKVECSVKVRVTCVIRY